MITQFNKENLRQLRVEIDAALAPVLQKHGLTATLGNISFDATSFTAPFKVKVLGENGRPVLSASAASFISMIHPNIPDPAKAVMIDHTGVKWMFSDYSSRASRMPYILINEQGKRIKTTKDFVTKYLQQ